MLTERQIEILHRAIELIAEKGIQGLTLKNLAREIGISEPAIYRHYENKIEILVSILDYFLDRTMGIFDAEICRDGSAIEKIERIFEAHFEVFSETPALVAVIFSEEIFRNEAVLTEKIKVIMGRNSLVIASIIEDAKASGQINPELDTKHLTVIIMGALRLLVKQWQMAEFSYDLRISGTSFFVTLKKLLLAD